MFKNRIPINTPFGKVYRMDSYEHAFCWAFGDAGQGAKFFQITEAFIQNHTNIVMAMSKKQRDKK
jgi:hypothetical protein